jgi:ketosteroid isomerase-like protein
MSAADAGRNMVEALGRGDLAAALQTIDPTVVMVQSTSLPWGGHYHGHQGIQKFATAMFQLCDAALLDLEIHDAGDVAVSKILTRFTARASGRAIEFPVVEIYHATEGKLTRIEPYYRDQAALLHLLNS